VVLGCARGSRGGVQPHRSSRGALARKILQNICDPMLRLTGPVRLKLAQPRRLGRHTPTRPDRPSPFCSCHEVSPAVWDAWRLPCLGQLLGCDGLGDLAASVWLSPQSLTFNRETKPSATRTRRDRANSKSVRGIYFGGLVSRSISSTILRWRRDITIHLWPLYSPCSKRIESSSMFCYLGTP
jgi:hypothetical protein